MSKCRQESNFFHDAIEMKISSLKLGKLTQPIPIQTMLGPTQNTMLAREYRADDTILTVH